MPCVNSFVAVRRKFVTIPKSPASNFIGTHAQPDRVAYTQTVALNIPAIQTALQQDGLDGWLLYDFHGSNPIAGTVVEVDSRTKMSMHPAKRSERSVDFGCPNTVFSSPP